MLGQAAEGLALHPHDMTGTVIHHWPVSSDRDLISSIILRALHATALQCKVQTTGTRVITGLPRQRVHTTYTSIRKSHATWLTWMCTNRLGPISCPTFNIDLWCRLCGVHFNPRSVPLTISQRAYPETVSGGAPIASTKNLLSDSTSSHTYYCTKGMAWHLLPSPWTILRTKSLCALGVIMVMTINARCG